MDIEVEKSDIRGQFAAPPIGKYGGDYSFAGMFLARAALDSSVICTNLSASSEQSGRIVLDILRAFGAKVTRGGDNVNVRADKLRGCEVSVAEFPQIAPITSLLALFCSGRSRISGFESDPGQLALTVENLTALGARCEIGRDELWVWPQRSVRHAVLNAKNRPYTAMALILISTYTPGITAVRGVDALIERYPGFMDTLASLGGKAKLCKLSLS